MQIAAYIIFLGLILIFLFYGVLGLFHAFKFSYLSKRTQPVAYLFIGSSVLLIILGLIFLFNVNWSQF